MNKSESVAALAASLSAAQGELENATKNAANPHYKSRYADLAEVLNTVRPVFAKHGLSFIQMPLEVESGVAKLETVLMHKSGEWLSSVSSATLGRNDAQGVGSVITYLRRYSLAAMAGIAQEDDDGNAASGKKKEELIGDAELSQLRALISGTGTDEAAFCKYLRVDKLEKLPLSEFAHAIGALNKKLKSVKEVWYE